MGVKNLWRLLLPVGHRLSIETLSHQTLAIDASIWLTQISKACRDPETGRLLPNKPHVRIFLLRLMRLLFHQIKPVVVFDGVMPEVKRREIQRRKDRRERLWRDDEDEGGTGGGGALKRTAKKILVKQLKEWRENEARLKKKNGGGGGGGGGKNNDAAAAAKNGKEKAKDDNGAFAAGFTVAGDSDGDDPKAPSSDKNEAIADTNKAKTGEKEDIISVDSKDSERNSKQKYQSQVNQFPEQQDGHNEGGEHQSESENDWEMSHAVQSTINNSVQQTSSTNNCTNNSTTDNDSDNDDANNPFDNDQHNETIASLPVEARSQWIDNQKSARRIQSRRECIEAAANPEDYSSIQLKNFLKGTKLNKRVGEIGKLVESWKDRKELSGGSSSNAQHSNRPAFQRLRRHGNHNADGDEEDNEMFNNSASSSTNRGPSMQVLFGEDDSDEEEDGGGGFLVSAPSDAKLNVTECAKSASRASQNNEVVLLDDDSDTDINLKINSKYVLKHEPAPSKERNNIIDLKMQPSNETKETTPPTTASSLQRSRLLELATAGEEWEQWGNNVADEEISPSEAEPNFNGVGTDARNNDDPALETSESESDDGDRGGFLMLGGVTNHPLTSASVEVGVNAIVTAPANDESLQKPDEDKFEEDDDDDEIDWEDGDSGCDQVGDESGTGNFDKENEVKEPEINDYVGISSFGDSSVVDSLRVDASDSNVIDSSRVDTNDAQNTALKHDKVNARTDVIEIPSENEVVLKIHPKAYTNTDPHESTPAQKDNKAMHLEIDSSDESLAGNEFESYRHDNEVPAALQQAQETASRLTDWAGRAFQRAILAHVGSQTKSGSPSKKKALEKEQIDLSTSDDAFDTSSRVLGDSTQVSGAKTTGMEDEGQDLSPTQKISSRKLELFDTSLEGLNEAHATILEEEKVMERDMSTITDEMKDDILALLHLCGIPWIESPSEAEAQCAALEELGLVDGVVTEDSDIFVFGGRKVYKNFFNEQKYVEAYFARDMERDLGLKKHQLVALAMLLGGDYTDGVKGVGIVNGMELLQAFPIEDSADGIKEGLQSFREWLDGFGEPKHNGSDKTYLSKQQLFHKKHKSARTRWLAPSDFPSQAIMSAYLRPAVDKSNAKFSWSKPNLPGLQQHCAETLGWEKEETDRVVNPVLKVLESGSKQTRLESYFMRYEDGVTFAKVRSKRLKAVLDDIQCAGFADENDVDMEGVAANGVDMKAPNVDEDSKPKKKRQRKKK